MQQASHKTESRPLHYREFGQGPTILFVHGWMVSGHIWDELLPLLDGFRLIVPDLRGAGGTPAGDGAITLDRYVADLDALCAALDLHDAHLVGNSMGGQLATLLAARAPQRFATLTLLSPVPVDGLALPEELLPVFGESGGDRERLGGIIDMACLRLPPAARERLLDEAVRIAPDIIRTSFDAWRQGLPGTSLGPATMPATVVATDDPFLPAAFLEQAVAARLPNARLVRLEGPGHYPQIEAPLETAQLLRSFIA